VYAGIFFALLAFVYWSTERSYQLGVQETTAKYETDLRVAQNEAIIAQNEHQKAINAVTQLWLNKKPEIEVKYERIEKEIIKYINNDESCNLTYGAAILLNSSAQPMQDNINPALTDGQKSAPSLVTQLETVETCIKWAEQYNELANQLDTLIDIRSD